MEVQKIATSRRRSGEARVRRSHGSSRVAQLRQQQKAATAATCDGQGWSGDRVAPRAGQCICMRLILATEFHFHSSIGSSSGSSDIQRRQRRHPLCSKPASLSVALTRHLRAFVKFSANRRQARTQARQFDEPPHTHTTPHIQ